MQLIGWTLIHSLWEGGVIALLLALAFSAARLSSASVRYGIGMIGLALMVALPVATASRMSPLTGVSQTGVTTSGSAVPSGPTGVPPSTTGSALTPAALDEPAGSTSLPAEPAKPFAWTASDAIASARSSMLGKIEPSLPWLTAAWLIGLVALSLRMIGGVARTRRIVHQGTSPARDRVLRLISRISEDLGVRRAVLSLEGTHLTVPVVIGWLRPVIVLPASLATGLTPWQLEMLLAHELAHIRRYDFLANMLQTVLETLLFFHPAARWLSDRIREERENCCDDIAVAACGGDRKGYTAALLALEESRDDGLGFAAAATGTGSDATLLRRAMRLMTGGPAHVDLGARWIAGVITILAAFFTTGPAMGRAADISVSSPMEVLGFLAAERESVPGGVTGLSAAAQSNPDTVLSYSGNGSFVERWRWAEQRAHALRSSRYWIGYLVAGDATGREMYYSDRETPVRSGASTFIGHIQIGDATDLQFSGSPLAPLVGNHAPTSTAIFLQFDRASGNEQVVRVHVGSFRFPVYFGNAPAIWLDSATDAESVAKLRGLAENTRSLEIRRDLVAAVGAHRDANVVLPPLIDWIESRSESEGIRREAAEALSHFPDDRAVAALARVARNDRNGGVRKEAIEAFEGMRLGAAADTLMAFATSLESSDLRRVAIESLGSRHEPRVVAFLTRLALGNADMRLRMDAIESLGSMHEEGFAAISDLARNAPDPDVRRTAVEELGNSQPADRALDLLGEIIRRDPDEAVRLKAVETLGEMHDDRAARSALVTIVRSEGDAELRRAAIEALGELRDGAALDTLRAVAQASGPERLRRQAMETYAENAGTETAVAFLRSIVADDPSAQIRLNALEILSELDHNAGIPAIRELARSSPDARVRKQALEILSEH
jgi:beta-lactamase regulating signal transducer with metallopeptidase domain/HEAT repeat protein